MLPRVSVLMPVYNTARFLQEALTSVSRQTWSDFELVVIDDGSSDDSLQVLQAHSLREPRMRCVTRENRGLIATRNELLALARGEWVAWMDSDDASTVDRLALQLEAFDRDPSLVCIGGAAQCIDIDGHFLNLERYPTAHEEIVREQGVGAGMRFPTTMMRRQTALEVGGFREPFRIGEDLDLLLRMAEAGRVANLAATLYFYRQHLSSVCAALRPSWDAYCDCILGLARERRETGSDTLQRGGTVEIAALEPTASSDSLEASIYAFWARSALDNGNRRLARKYARSAVVSGPWTLASWKALARAVLAPGSRVRP